MSLAKEFINFDNLEQALKTFIGNKPFDHCIIDNFFKDNYASDLSNEFIDYKSEKWFYYKNPIEDKKALNDWNIFPQLTYKVFTELYSKEFMGLLSKTLNKPLYPDLGLHGGGWHIHGTGGNLNPHLDYSIHPKLDLERKLNIIIYLSKELKPHTHGGHLGLWEQEDGQPGKLIKEVEPIFNRAIIFDTTQNSWHGMSRTLTQPEGIYRKSLAAYYLTDPASDASTRNRALFAPREQQKNDENVKEIIRLRSNVKTSELVYKTNK